MDFTKVPYDDVVVFITSKGSQISPDPTETYQIGADLLNEVQTGEQIPVSVSDFLIATSLYDAVDINTYKLSDIYENRVDLTTLSQRFNTTDKDRIIRILNYMNKLENDINIYEFLPIPALAAILSNLSLTDIMGLCQSSQSIY